MLKVVHDIFTIVVNLIVCDWEVKHVTIGLLKVIDIDIVMTPKL